MYKLVIADDEEIIRNGLTNIVDWNELGFEVIAAFSDGQEVLESLDYLVPDVILTDIKMSNVSGLEVVKYVSEHKIPSKVILISGHQEFNLAVQGIRYGAENYLLKPTDVDCIITTFQEVKTKLDLNRFKQRQAKAEKARIEEMVPILEERFFADLVFGGIVNSNAYIKNQMSILYPELDVTNSVCFLADITIDHFEHFISEQWEYGYDQLEVELANFFRVYKQTYFFHIVYKSGELIEVMGLSSGNEITEEDCLITLQALVEKLTETFKFKAQYKLRCMYDSIFEVGKIEAEIKSLWDDKDRGAHYLEEKKKLIMSNITIGNIATAQKIFGDILRDMDKLPTVERNSLVVELLQTMNKLIGQINAKLAESLQPYFDYSLIRSMNKIEEVQAYCSRIFDRIKMAEEKQEHYNVDSLVGMAKIYIQNNLYRDVSQEETANHLFICPSYLSRLFKEKTGENFTQYVTKLKMEEAMILLENPAYKTYQIGEELGYKTPRYFSRLFRAHTGMNPSEYRRNILRSEVHEPTGRN